MTWPALACPCCGAPMPPRLTHRRKPYYICDPCGVQVFVRRQEGMDRLRRRRPQTAEEAWPWADES